MANKRYTHPAESIERLKKQNRRRLIGVSALVALAGGLLIHNLDSTQPGEEAENISIQTASGVEQASAASEAAASEGALPGVVLEPAEGAVSQTELANPFAEAERRAQEAAQAAASEADQAVYELKEGEATVAASAADGSRRTVVQKAPDEAFDQAPEPVVTISNANQNAEQAAKAAREKADAAAKQLAEEKRRAAEAAEAERAAKAKTAAQAQQAADAEKERLRKEAQLKREESVRRAAEEKRKQQEAQQTAEAKKAADAKKAAEAKRLAEEKRAAETKKQAEAKKLAEEKRAAEAKKQADAKRQAEAKADAARRAAEEKRAAEAKARAALNNQSAKTKSDPQAILNGKAGGGKAIIQAGAFTALQQAQQKLANAGISAHISEADTSKGKVYRVRTGAYPSRAAADAALAKIRAQGLDGMVIGR